MSTATIEKTSYRAAWELEQGRLRGNLPEWLLSLREEAFAEFERRGFPTTADEEWKYTSVAAVERAGFETVESGGACALKADAICHIFYPETSRSRLVFVNGSYCSELSSRASLPARAVLSDLRTALAGEHAGVLREHFDGAAAARSDGFSALNAAFTAEGAFVYLPRGVRLAEPLHLLFVAGQTAAPAAYHPRVVILAEQGSEATVIESYEAATGGAYLTNAVVDVLVRDDARVRHFKVQREGEGAYHVAATNAELGRAAAYDLTTITLGAKLSRHGIGVRMAHEGAECWVDGLYLVGEGQHADTHSAIDHAAPRCTSHQLYKGILDGRSRAVFNGKVFVRPDAQGTDAQQTNKNLLLSPEARVDTKPQLEIFNDDVKCSHGATVGQLEEEELFYLKSRGLHEELARNLLTYGFAEELIEKLKIESIKRQLDEAILNRLQARLEA